MTIQITEHGIGDAIALLQGIQLARLRGAIADLLRDMAADAGDYPPQRAGSRYRRTDALHDGWIDTPPMVDLRGGALMGAIVNPVPYGPVVMGADDQARIHVGHWRTTDAILDAWEDRAADRIEAALGEVIQ